MLNSGPGRPVPTGHQPVLVEPARTLGLVYRLETVRTEMNRSHICQTDRARLDMQGRSISGLLDTACFAVKAYFPVRVLIGKWACPLLKPLWVEILSGRTHSTYPHHCKMHQNSLYLPSKPSRLSSLWTASRDQNSRSRERPTASTFFTVRHFYPRWSNAHCQSEAPACPSFSCPSL